MDQENCMFPTASVEKPYNSWGFGQGTQTKFASIMGQNSPKINASLVVPNRD